MKNSLLLLGVLLVLCISLPFIFNVKYNENFATYPSETDISLSDASFVEGMTNPAFTPPPSSVAPIPVQVPVEVPVAVPVAVPTTSGPSSSNSLDDNVYSSYDKKIDKNLRNKGNSVSDYMRKNPPDTEDEFKNRVESNSSILDFLIGLYRNNKEAFTSTHTLKDVSNNVTYDILPNQELYNIDGELKLGTHDATDYGALLENVKKEFNDLKNKHDENNYVTKTDVASGLDDLTKRVTDIISGMGGMPGSMPSGMPGSMPSGMPGSMPGGMPGSMPDGMSGANSGGSYGSSGNSYGSYSNQYPNQSSMDASNNTNSSYGYGTNSNYQGSYNSPVTNAPGMTPVPAGSGGMATGSQGASKCIANFGTEIDEPLCCGQEGVLKSTKYTCPENYPTCTGYKCGSNFGTCS